MSEINESQKEFEAKLDDKIEQVKNGEIGSEIPKKRGRKRKEVSGTSEKSPSPSKTETASPVPPVNEAEAFIYAQMFSGLANMFIREPYKEKIKFTPEEFLNITRPGVQLKDYYAPNFGGVYVVWGQLALSVGALGFSKYQIIQDIIKEEDGKRKPKFTAEPVTPQTGGNLVTVIPANNSAGTGTESHSDIGNAGNGQVYESQRIIIPPIKSDCV